MIYDKLIDNDSYLDGNQIKKHQYILNYCYIENLGRYYFISDIKVLKNELFELSLKCDVLYTYKNEIENTHAIITESTNEINEHNASYIAEKDINTQIINLENPFNADSDVLISIVGN